MLGLDNPIHIAFLLVLVLLVFGAKRLPEMGHSLGAGLRGFKESLSGETQTTQLSSSADTTSAADLSTVHSASTTSQPEPERTSVGPVA